MAWIYWRGDASVIGIHAWRGSTGGDVAVIGIRTWQRYADVSRSTPCVDGLCRSPAGTRAKENPLPAQRVSGGLPASGRHYRAGQNL
ncbi:hypothetical protein [Stenotrophomonas sp. HMWF023]|uniref:hypothetical protein n=1 Tax=Stenotrophomonas sp. HMWF023 TaxID=2056859 RepID=UPI0011B20510|nr:hypothetical protein [Stenotrophomonas sp. HMWF023]